MSNDIPEWITNLALDIYRLIQKYDALASFQEKVREWAIGHETEANRLSEWRRQRNHHFEQTVNSDPRLQDEKSGPPDEGWEWEIYSLNISPQIDPDTKLPIKIVKAWVPPELLRDSEPDIKYILPLSREQQLSLTEKYTLLAAIYDFGRKGTDQIPPWVWPDLNTDVSSDELADAKKCLSFESLCDAASSLHQDNEGWLRTFLYDVENDLRKNRPSAKNPILSKPFLNNLLRASIKHLPYVGSFLYDVIYGTDNQPQTKLQLDSTPDDNIETEHRKVNSGEPKKERGGWGLITKIGLILGIIVSLIVIVGAYNKYARKDKPAIKQIETPKTETKQIAENKLDLSLRNICRDIDSRPLAQQAETEKQYWGLRIKRERLKVLEVEINPGDESIYNLVLTFPDQPTFPNSKWRILCTVSKDQYPQLRLAREGMEFYLSGEIEMTFRRDRVPYIDLSNITLEFE